MVSLSRGTPDRRRRPSARGTRATGQRAGGQRTAGQGGSRSAPGRQRRTTGPGPTRATAAAQARLTRRPPAGLTGRALLLGVVVCALVLSLAYPIREYVAQRSEIAALEQTARETQARVDALEELQLQLQDPAYIEAQARERLNYAMPGDRVFVVVDGATAPEEDSAAETALPADGDSWLERLGESVRRADSG